MTETIDEQGSITLEYKDKEGRLVLKKVQHQASTAPTDDDFLFTYYVYDDFGLLRYVLPTEAVYRLASVGGLGSSTPADETAKVEYLTADKLLTSSPTSSYIYAPWVKVTLGDGFIFTATASESFFIRPEIGSENPKLVALLEQYAFRYDYDKRGRMIEKKVPGAAPVYLVYNLRDQPILTQDGNQRNLAGSEKWSFTKYDAFGRVIMSGTLQSSATRQALQDEADKVSAQWENPNSVGPHHYTLSQAYPKLIEGITYEIQTVNYYDNYDFNEDGSPEEIYNPAFDSKFTATANEPLPTPFYRVVGMATASIVKVLNASPEVWLKRLRKTSIKILVK